MYFHRGLVHTNNVFMFHIWAIKTPSRMDEIVLAMALKMMAHKTI